MNKLSSRLFEPAVGLLERLSYPRKFLLISGLFALPIVVLVTLLFSEIGERIAFAAKERDGVEYLKSLAILRQSLYRAEFADPAEATAELAVAARGLSEVNRRLRQTLETDTPWSSLERALSRSERNSASAGRRDIHESIQREVSRLNAWVGDRSNLILDPDLDTYYLMDAIVLKLPEIEDIAISIRRLAGAVDIGQAAGRAEQRARLMVLSGRLRGLLDALHSHLNVAFAESHARPLHRVLRQPLAALREAGQDLMRSLEPLVEADASLRMEVYARSAVVLLERSLDLWGSTATELYQLLEQRIEGHADKRLAISGLVVVVLVLVAYLFTAFYLAVMRTVSCLDAAARKMAAGEAGSALTLSNRDELGQVARSFNRIAEALVNANREIRQLNESLTAENLRMAAELDVSRRLQQMILPRDEELNRIEELDIAGFMEPAAQVGGDYYDVLNYEGGIKFGIGDVTGHDLESGVLMIMVQTAVRTLLAANETDTVKIFNTLNRAIYDNVRRMDSDKNLSLILVGYKDGVLHLSGQHEEVIVVRADGRVERIDTLDLGFPIGLDADIAAFIAEIQVPLRAGDGMVLYTDGITEAVDRHNRLYGMDRLCEVVSRNWSQPAMAIREAVIEDVRRHIGGHTVYDDITLLVIKQRPEAG